MASRGKIDEQGSGAERERDGGSGRREEGRRGVGVAESGGSGSGAEREREMAVEDEKRGEEALEWLRATDPPLYLSPSLELSQHARAAVSHLFSALLPFYPKSPVDRLLADEGFDAEQIWYQIDSWPMRASTLSSLVPDRPPLQPPPLHYATRGEKAGAGTPESATARPRKGRGGEEGRRWRGR